MASAKKTNDQMTANGYGRGLKTPTGNPVNYSPGMNYAGSGKGVNAPTGSNPTNYNPNGTTYAGSGKGLNAPAGSNPVNHSPNGTTYSGSGKGIDPATGSAYTGLEGVSKTTGEKLGGYQEGYKPSDKVTAAEAALADWQAQKPEGYSGKYSTQLESILQQIANPGEFKYSFDGDNLFQSYLDSMTQKGKQASLDAMGQAAGLTGGYGSSYGQMVGNQAYQQYLTNAYDNALQYYDRAYQRYMDQQNNLYNQYSTIAGADETDYGRYRDTVGDWQNERDYLTGRADTENERDYSRYSDALNYWTGLAQVENADYRSEQERQEAIRQYEKDYAERVREFDVGVEEGQKDREMSDRHHSEDLNMDKYKTDTSKELSEKELAEKTREFDIGVEEGQKDRELDKYKADRSYDLSEKELEETIREFDKKYDYDNMSEDRKYAYETVMNILAKGKMPSDKLLKAAGIDKEDAELLMEITTNSSTGGNKKDPGTYYVFNDKIYTVDKNGNIKEADPNKIPDNAEIDETTFPTYWKTASDIGNTAADIGDKLVKITTNITNKAKKTGNSFLDFLGIKKK